MKSMKISSAPGPDGFPSMVLHDYAQELAQCMCMLWRRSMDTQEMPDGINIAYVTPIFKGGDKSMPKNYRPVSLTSHITKVFEKVMHKAIMNHLKINELLNETQHGFRQRRSTLTQLISYHSDIICSIENDKNVDSVYLDFSKAFDKCDQHIILRKLKLLGITGKIGKWISSFLSNRQQSVVIDGHTSKKEWVLSGVPQGSVLGPLLFIIMIYDIDAKVIHSSLASYADDTRIWRKILDSGDNLLQCDLDNVYAWANDNNMLFNNMKFESLSFGRNQQQIQYTNPGGAAIECKESLRDLGVTLSSDCLFNIHIANIASSGRLLSGWILRTFKNHDRKILLPLLKQIVISKLEYCCPLWSPLDAENIRLLEDVQRTFTRRINGMFGRDRVSYWKRLEILKLYSLQRRRERYIIIYVWKVINNLVPNPGLKINYNPRTGYHLDPPRHNNKIRAWIRNLIGSSLISQGPALFNTLPIHLRQKSKEVEPKIPTFKTMLDKYLQIVPDQPTIPGHIRAAATNSIIHQSWHVKST